jgi:hypothetical protein
MSLKRRAFRVQRPRSPHFLPLFVAVRAVEHDDDSRAACLRADRSANAVAGGTAINASCGFAGGQTRRILAYLIQQSNG